MTITVLDALEDLDRELSQLGVVLHLAAVPASAKVVAERTPWFAGLESAGRVHGTLREGITAAESAIDAGMHSLHQGEVDDAP